ncbi:hypothetical protein K493DRAFT_388865 [Basidiobolus meristosporus CBS 931.73]|uniref:Membrane magnesium transporter n=1 Tax=Basidiobolus meristosporus CBS 931.73 TaxID=1314790 RepID=A0A1Y1YU49_9FUNG|nr:hypothetical protein K493DRAFT_388865 [Basidiobolus meristosporus CBS 931.73]|eukprot:ORY01563.1 hypothetical protein K493DRAFT_388865 [Basidiobolus meristosporus CBS 931.73]
MITPPHLPGKILSLVGLLVLAHSAYSTYERKISFCIPENTLETKVHHDVDLSYLKAAEKLENGLPADIIFECLLGVLIFMFGFTLVSGSLKPILMEIEMSKQTIAKFDSRPSFQTFNHRGVHLHSKAN